MMRLWRAWLNSCAGLTAAWHDEQAFRQDVLLFVITTPLALWLAPDRLSLVLMLASVGLILIVELLNTGIEAAIDRIGPELHPQAKKAKDCASAAVLLSLISAAVTWLVILL